MDLQLWNRLRRWGNAASFFGIMQFICLTAVAMQTYPGGAPLNEGTSGYSFFENPLSDLGRDQSWSGSDNSFSARLFSTSLILLSLLIVPFFVFMPTHAPDKFWLMCVAASFGVLSTFGLMGIALTPYDIYPTEHITALFCWLVPVFLAASIHFVGLLLSKESSLVVALVSLGLAVLTMIYIGRGYDLVVAALSGKEPPIQQAVVVQKYVAMYCVVWYAVFSLRMTLTKEVVPANRQVNINAQAKQYLKQVQGGYRKR